MSFDYNSIVQPVSLNIENVRYVLTIKYWCYLKEMLNKGKNYNKELFLKIFFKYLINSLWNFQV